MSPEYKEVMRAVGEATEADPAAVERVRRRLDPRLLPTTHLLARLPEPPERSAERVRARLAERARTGRSRAPARFALAGAGLTFAAAAAAAVAFTVAPVEVAPVEVAPVEVALGSEPVAVSEHVRLTPAGEGSVTGLGETWAVGWEQGDLAVAVTPEAGVDLTVTTPEAVVRVVGTVFDVRRDRLGTTVTVEQGRVAVDCTLGDDVTLAPGERHTCWPTTAAGLLGRTRALEEQGAGAAELLAVADLGLDQPDATGPVRAELLAARLAPLVEAGHHEEALASAEAYLEAGGSRPEIRRYAALLALSLGDCERARVHLLALPDRSAQEQAALERCAG